MRIHPGCLRPFGPSDAQHCNTANLHRTETDNQSRNIRVYTGVMLGRYMELGLPVGY